jgi:hypothetical protein
MIDTGRLLSRCGNYKMALSGAVTDRTLMEIATQFETQVSRKMTALTPEQLGKRFITTEPVLETTKYDGEGVLISFDKSSGIFAFNAPSGRVRVGLPALEALEKHLKAQGIQRGLFRAELYLPHTDPNSKRPNVADVVRVSSGGSLEEVATLKFVMLDIIMLDGKDHRPNQEKFAETWELLGKLFGTDNQTPFHRATGSIVPENQLSRVFQERVAKGEEGLVVRRLQRLEISKIKPHVSVDAVVIGYVEGEFEGKYGVTSLLTALNYAEKKNGKLLLQTFCRVGSGLTDQQREELLGVLSTQKVGSPIAMTDSDGRTVHFVTPTHIVEIHGEDLINASSREKENRTQFFSHDGSSYEFIGLVPFPRLTFATFNTLRPDKGLATGGARIDQIIPNAQPPQIRAEESRPPEVIRREVYVKAEAVRKLVILKTSTAGHVPFLVYWTDFSAKRKDPLKVSTQCAYTEERAQALAAKLIAENITKGFNLVSGDGAATATKPASSEPPQSPETPPTSSTADEAKPKRTRAKKATT